jgi:hypothetical protein
MPTGLEVTRPAPLTRTVRKAVVSAAPAKDTLTLFADSIATVQVGVGMPAQAPPQPVKAEAAAGLAVRVTVVAREYGSVQSPGQLTPAGLLVTLPLPVPARLTLRAAVVAAIRENAALTFRARSRVTTQVPVPEQPSPLQPRNCESAAAVAVSVTVVPPGKMALQAAPQLIAAGSDVTVPEPGPCLATVKVKPGVVSGTLKIAATQRRESLPVLRTAVALVAPPARALETS